MTTGLADPAGSTWEKAVEWLRAQPGQEEFVRQCYYDDPVLAAAARFCASEEWAGICELLADRLPARVLELGAGRGIVSFAFACRGCDVVAVEPDPSALVGRGAIRELSTYAPRPIGVLADWGERIDVPDASIEVAYCRAVLHHAADLSHFCREVARVLRPGGVFLAEREHVIDQPEDLPAFLAAHPLHHRYGGERAYMLHEYTSALRAAGLRVRRVIPPYNHVMNLVPPMDGARLRRMTAQALVKTRLVPPPGAAWLARARAVRDLYARTLSWRSRMPGRFYSFLAAKPG